MAISRDECANLTPAARVCVCAPICQMRRPAARDEGEARIKASFGENFEHNLHALRIVEHFEHRYARFPGLNLTFEVREGIVKHSHDFQPGENPEVDEYLPGLRPPLEAHTNLA